MPKLFLKPDTAQYPERRPILYISGTLPPALIEQAYEGRLKINNAVGNCVVEQTAGSQLPNGSQLFVDQVTKEIVIVWPAFSENASPLANPGFETGTLAGWSFTTTGGTGAPVIDTQYKYSGNFSLKWPGGAGLGSEGGIELYAWNDAIAECYPGRSITGHTRCMYNPAGHHFHTRYQGILRFLDMDGVQIGDIIRGPLFKGRGQNGRWNDAYATARAPARTRHVQMGAWLTGAEAPSWLDAASWDAPSIVGTNQPAELPLTLRVTDDAGRVATWTGVLSIKPRLAILGFRTSIALTDSDVTYDETVQAFVAVSQNSRSLWTSPAGEPGTWTQLPNVLTGTVTAADSIHIRYIASLNGCAISVWNASKTLYFVQNGVLTATAVHGLQSDNINLMDGGGYVFGVGDYGAQSLKWAPGGSITWQGAAATQGDTPRTMFGRAVVLGNTARQNRTWPLDNTLSTIHNFDLSTPATGAPINLGTALDTYTFASYAPLRTSYENTLNRGLIVKGAGAASSSVSQIWTFASVSDVAVRTFALTSSGIPTSASGLYIPWAGQWAVPSNQTTSGQTNRIYTAPSDASVWTLQAGQITGVPAIYILSTNSWAISRTKRKVLLAGAEGINQLLFEGDV